MHGRSDRLRHLVETEELVPRGLDVWIVEQLLVQRDEAETGAYLLGYRVLPAEILRSHELLELPGPLRIFGRSGKSDAPGVAHALAVSGHLEFLDLTGDRGLR